MSTTTKERVSESSWDGSASRFSDEQYQRSCVLDRKVCGGDWASKPPKERCSLPIREPGGALSRAGVHAAASRIGEVKDACPAAIASAKAKLRSAYSQLGEKPPASIGGSEKSKDDEESTRPTIHRDRALAALEDGVWEFRSEGAKKGTLGTLAGYFAVFNRWTHIDSPFEGSFMERIAPGAFTKTFQENRNGMRVLLNHGKDPSVGMKPLGPIRDLSQDDTGAYYEVELLDTSYNRDIVPGLEAGQYGASFRFQVMSDQYAPNPERTETNPKGIPECTITEAKVREFGPVTFPAYADATASLRSINDELQMLDLRLFAASDPKGIARFAQFISNVPDLSGANVGTRNNPTPEDWGISFALKEVKKELAGVKAKQLNDPDHGKDPDDAAVMSAIEKAEAAIDEAIVAQSKDAHEDEGEGRSSEPESECANEETEAETRSGERSDDRSNEAQSSPSDQNRSHKQTHHAPAMPAPVKGPKHPGSTLVKRAAPLYKPNEGTPKWKL